MRGVLVAVVAAIGIARAQTTLPIDWEEVTVSASSPLSDGVPVGCKCVDTSQSPCEKFDCGCVCDITAGACDGGCCCDTDCSSSLKSEFDCLPEGPGNGTLVHCVDLDRASELAEVNPKYRMVSARRSLGGQRLLCIAVDNNPVVGTFFGVEDVRSSAVFARNDLSELPSFCDASCAATTTRSSSAVYAPGDVVLAAVNVDGSGLVTEGGGGLRLPGPLSTAQAGRLALSEKELERTALFAFDGASIRSSSASVAGSLGGGPADVCSEDGVGVRFLEDVGVRGFGSTATSTGREKTGALLGGTCRSFGNGSSVPLCPRRQLARFTRQLYIGKTPRADPNDASGYIQVDVGTVRVVDAATGQVTATLSNSQAGQLSTQTSYGDSCNCTNAVVAVRLRIGYDSSGEIARAVADADVVSVVDFCSKSSVPLPLSTSVQFTFENGTLPSVTSSASLNDGRITPRPRSGNPGYIYGEPILAGYPVELSTADGTKTAISSYVDGLQLPAPLVDGSCPVSTSSASASFEHVPVAFGDDVTVGCTASLPRAVTAFGAACNALTMPAALQTNFTRLGLFGNSDPLDPDQWMQPTIQSTAGISPTFDATNLACDDVIVEAHLQILAARVGEKANPQRKIVSAKLSFATATVHLPRGSAVTADLDADTFPYEIRFVVSFAELGDGQLTPFIPPPPSLVKLPFGLWYPFELDERDAPRTVDASLINTDAANVQGTLTTSIAVLLAIAIGTIAWGCAAAL